MEGAGNAVVVTAVGVHVVGDVGVGVGGATQVSGGHCMACSCQFLSKSLKHLLLDVQYRSETDKLSD